MQNIKTFVRMYHQLVQILNSKQRRMAILVAFLAMISALMETLGVSVVLPFIVAMLQPAELMKNQRILGILEILDISSTWGMLALLAGVIIFIYISKNALVMLFNYIQLSFRNTLERDLSIVMMRSYIYKPYSFFLNVNSADIMRGVTGDISGVAAVVDGYCQLLNEGLTCILIGTVLIVINPLIAFSLLALAGGTALVIINGLRKKVAQCGQESREAFSRRSQHIYQAVNGIKEIHVMKRQENFLRFFSDAADLACQYNTKYLWMAMLPSRVIEVIFLSGLIILVLFSYRSSDNMTFLIAQFGSLAVASIRILPAISNITRSVNALIYNRLALENAYENIVEGKLYLAEEDRVKSTIDVSKMQDGIRINQITWKYEKGMPNVLEGLDLEIKPGEAVGLIGESGAGKTTLADIILGLFEPQQGTVTVDGKSIYAPETGWHRMVGYVPQNIFLMDDTVRNNILFGIDEEEIDEDRVWKAIEQAQMKEFIEQLPQGLDTVLGEQGIKISGGQRQRIAIARALYYDPDILVLDEATSALDNETENAVIESINALQKEKTLIIVAHRLSTIANCDRIYEIKDGKAILRDRVEVLAGK